MKDIPLTPEQRVFAEKNHNLLLQFLRKRELSIQDYYDVVVFGYLKGVRDYLSKEYLQRYSFSTICWRSMLQSLSNYHRREKKQGQWIALESIHLLPQNLPAVHDLTEEMECRLLMHDLAAMITEEEIRIVRMRFQGHSIRKIAHDCNIPMREVKTHLDHAHTALKELCNME